jgi:hypothetical protein
VVPTSAGPFAAALIACCATFGDDWDVIEIRSAEHRLRSDQPGITSWHCFSAGAYYDPENLSFGPLVGVDEHLVAPGAGFDWHAHSGIDIVSWVLEGTLRHEDSAGQVRLVRPAEWLVQSTGTGLRHSETNASDTEPLRFVQSTLLDMTEARFEVWGESGVVESARSHLFVGAGRWELGDRALAHGDSVRGDGRLAVTGNGQLLVWLLG